MITKTTTKSNAGDDAVAFGIQECQAGRLVCSVRSVVDAATLAFSNIPGPPRPLKVIKYGHSTCQDRVSVSTLDGELAHHYG